MNANNRKYPSLEEFFDEFFPDDYESYPDQEFDALNEFEKPVIGIANADVSANDTLEIKFRLGNCSLILFCFFVYEFSEYF